MFITQLSDAYNKRYLVFFSRNFLKCLDARAFPHTHTHTHTHTDILDPRAFPHTDRKTRFLAFSHTHTHTKVYKILKRSHTQTQTHTQKNSYAGF